jgi:CRISPR-associated protein Cmr5
VSRQRSLEQERAKAAWERVIEVKGKPYAAKYNQLARGAAADIQANGLGQTLAFWRAKGRNEGEEHHRVVFDHVSDWVRQRLRFTEPDLLQWVMGTADTDGYRRATAEAIAFLVWLRRFAEAELPKGDRDDGRTDAGR